MQKGGAIRDLKWGPLLYRLRLTLFRREFCWFSIFFYTNSIAPEVQVNKKTKFVTIFLTIEEVHIINAAFCGWQLSHGKNTAYTAITADLKLTATDRI